MRHQADVAKTGCRGQKYRRAAFSIEHERIVFGSKHENTLMTMGNWAGVLTQERKYAEAEA